jgi:hypothetical protein
MKLKNISKYVASSSKVIMTIIVFLFAVHILQIITIELSIELSSEMSRMLVKTKHDLSAAEPTKQLGDAEKRLQRIHHSGKNFLPDGTIHLTQRQGRTPGRFDEPEKVQIYDVNDVLIWQGLESENHYEYLSWYDQRFRPYTMYHQHLTERRMNELQMITPEFSRILEAPILTQDGTVQVWRYLPGSDLFMGYRLDGSIIGFLGSAGFAHSKSEARPFGNFKLQSSWYPAGALEPTVLWQTSRHLYEINFHKQQVRLLFESPKTNIKALILRECRPIDTQMQKEQKIKYRPTIRIMTEDKKHHLLMRNPEQTLTITFTDEKWSNNLNFAATEEDMFLIHHDSEIRPLMVNFKSPKLYQQWLSKHEGKPYKRWVELYKVDNQANLHLLNRYEWTVAGEFLPRIQRKSFRLHVQRAVTAFSAPLYDLAWFVLGPEFFIQRYRDRGNDFISGSIRMIADIRPVNSLWSWLLTIAMVGIAFLHGWPRRTYWDKLIFWLLFILAFNLAGLLTYLALNHTAVIKCPVCGRRRGLARFDCVRCRAELPAPERGKLDLIFST